MHYCYYLFFDLYLMPANWVRPAEDLLVIQRFRRTKVENFKKSIL